MEEIRCEEIRLELFREAIDLVTRLMKDWKEEADRYQTRLTEIVTEEGERSEKVNIEDHWEYARMLEYTTKYSVAEEVIKEMTMHAMRKKQR